MAGVLFYPLHSVNLTDDVENAISQKKKKKKEKNDTVFFDSSF